MTDPTKNNFAPVSRRSFNKLALALGTATMTGALGDIVPVAEAASTQQHVLKFIPNGGLRILDPIWTTSYIVRNFGYMVYDTLFAMDEHFKPQPQMVDTYKKSSDGLTYTFTLRDGLHWHDGTPVTAKDCLASLKRWGQRDSMGQNMMKAVKTLEAKNAKTFEIILSKPYGLVLEALAKTDSNVPFMMPEKLANTSPDKQIQEVNGSGPFKFVKDEFEPGAKAVFKKNDKYVPRNEPPSRLAGGKVVHVERVEWKAFPDTQTAMNALLTGEVDYWESVPPDQAKQVHGHKHVQIEIINTLGNQGWLRPNQLWPPFNNVKARQALLWMTSQKEYMEAALGNDKFWQECGAFFVCGTPNATSVGSKPLLTQNFGKAKSLLKESGYDGQPIVLLDPTDVFVLHRVAEVTAQLLQQIGAKVDIQAMDFSTLVSRRAQKDSPKKGGWNLFPTWGASVGALNPISNVAVAADCGQAWYGWPCDKETEKLRDQYAYATSAKERKKIIIALQKRLYDTVIPYINYGQFTIPSGHWDYVQGVIKSSVPVFWNIKLTKKA